MSQRPNWIWLGAFALIAVLVHGFSVYAVPRVIMARAMARIAPVGGLNHMGHGQRPTARSRGVVRPSPDLLYSTCAYDLDAAGGAVRVHATGMPKTYWSVSVFDAATDNFHVVNDRKAGGDSVDFVIIAPGAFVDTKLPVVVSPSNKGLALVRTLINDETHFAEIDRARRNARCEPFKAG